MLYYIQNLSKPENSHNSEMFMNNINVGSLMPSYFVVYRNAIMPEPFILTENFRSSVGCMCKCIVSLLRYLCGHLRWNYNIDNITIFQN